MKIDEEYYMIVDLEATCSNDESIPRNKMEIIEIGAVLLNAEKLIVEQEFQSFIKPVIYPTLTPFCKQLTTITQHDVDNAEYFPNVYEKFIEWTEQVESYRFCSWGKYDFNQFNTTCSQHHVTNLLPKRHMNIKVEFSKFLGTRKGYGLAKALDSLGLKMHGIHHRGIDDAKSIARIVKKVILQ